MTAKLVPEQGMVEAGVMYRKVPLRINTSKHFAVSSKIIGWIAVKEISIMLRNDFLKTGARNRQTRAPK